MISTLALEAMGSPEVSNYIISDLSSPEVSKHHLMGYHQNYVICQPKVVVKQMVKVL